MTYKQAQALGAQVRESERSQIAFFYKSYSKTAESPVTGDATDEMRRVLRSYAVFNADQIKGLPERFRPSPLSVVPPADMLPDRAQRFVNALPATVHIHGDRAFYDRTADSITMPAVEQFSTRAYRASTLAHEAGHWTGHADRLDREFGKKFGDDAYAFEELCAEMTAALLGADPRSADRSSRRSRQPVGGERRAKIEFVELRDLEATNRRTLPRHGRDQPRQKGPPLDPERLPDDRLDHLIQSHRELAVVETLRAERERRTARASLISSGSFDGALLRQWITASTIDRATAARAADRRGGSTSGRSAPSAHSRWSAGGFGKTEPCTFPTGTTSPYRGSVHRHLVLPSASQVQHGSSQGTDYRSRETGLGDPGSAGGWQRRRWSRLTVWIFIPVPLL